MTDSAPFWQSGVKHDDGYSLPRPVVDLGLSYLAGNPQLPEWRRQAREIAARLKLTEFTAPCPRHGEHALADTETGACFECLLLHADLPAPLRFRAAMGSAYVTVCPVHGEAMHRFGSAGCSQCRDARGRPLKQSKARATARKGGQKYYSAQCHLHGLSDHYVSIGKCAQCYTTNGVVRQTRLGRPGNETRAAARAAGDTSYLATCEKHGPVPHHTIRGKCLTCYNSLGSPRKKLLTPGA